jgi:hypothetical protein
VSSNNRIAIVFFHGALSISLNKPKAVGYVMDTVLPIIFDERTWKS